MASPLQSKPSKTLLLSLLNLLADFDGQISDAAANILQILKHRSDPLPPLYADVFGLPFSSTCAELVDRIHALTEDQVKVASYAFQIFRSYEQLLRVNTATVAPEQQAAYESQLSRIRVVVARTRSALAEALSDNP
ncbi:hypothetical protein [Egbenema bharatensis]|uniref:hypothetical protein n=1 Tax=Egbenema bharatensis TaxID=3463334 RepID=UPI003A8AF34F